MENQSRPWGKRRPEAEAYQHLWKSKRWKQMRREQLRREPTCRMCKALDRETKATVADHIIPHRGDRFLFYRMDNLQSLCDIHHSEKIRVEEGGRPRSIVGVDGWPI